MLDVSGYVQTTANYRSTFRGRALVNTWAADHTMTLARGTPVLALEMYEHAYALDHGPRRSPMSTRPWER